MQKIQIVTMTAGSRWVSALLVLYLWIPAAVSLLIPPHNETARVARFVAHHCDWGALATISSHAPVTGQPFANVFSVSDGPFRGSTGVPYMYLTDMEISVQDLQVNPNASLTLSLAQTHYCKNKGYDPQSPLCAHIILSGSIQKVNGSETDIAKVALFSRHPEMVDWPHDHNWFFAKLNITNIWVLDYFGGIKTVTPEDYYNAKP
ncbi:protein CREG1 [Bombina bombina]|uniref:protein CREG1 n=1 Tax=Bombina bombina TaxID=8345 RepID=UPI00235B0AAD|nr:protein CREG1 [Bombina bombina]